MPISIRDSIEGCLFGTAVGDALGLSFEGLSRRRLQKLSPDLSRYHLLFNKGMCSDDTEHTCLVAAAVVSANGDLLVFQKQLAHHLRIWFLGLPAGIGWASLRACLRLLIGFSPQKSGVFSAGNAPAMRVALLGVCYGDQAEKLTTYVKAATVISHTDNKAYYAALSIAIAAHLSTQRVRVTSSDYYAAIQAYLQEDEAGKALSLLIKEVCKSVEKGEKTTDFACACGLEKGVTGYSYHTVPVALHCWLTHQDDYHAGVVEMIRCGGDTDTCAAIVGALIGAGVGRQGIPSQLINNLYEFPRSVTWLERLSKSVYQHIAEHKAVSPPSAPYPFLLLRNIFFMLVVLTHGFRRLLPPY